MKAPILSYKCSICGKVMKMDEDLAQINKIYVHTDCLINDVELNIKTKFGKLNHEFQETYDLAMKEISRLRRKLKYD